MNRQYSNAVYYPSWRVYRGLSPAKLQVDCITHVYYAFARVNEDGTLKYQDDWADAGIAVDGVKGNLAALAKLKAEHPHLRTLLSVGGGAGSKPFPVLASTPAGRDMFARSCRAWCDQFGFNGIDVDWEHPDTPEKARDFHHLIATLRQYLPPPFLITSALPAGVYCLRLLDVGHLAAALDTLNLMAYDFVGSWTDVSGNQAQLHSPAGGEAVYPTLRRCTTSAVDHLLERGFPAHKIALGIPAYARGFVGARAPGHPFTKAVEVDYRDMKDEWVRGAWVDRQTVAAGWAGEGVAAAEDAGKKEGEARCAGPEDLKQVGFLSFDVPETVWLKAEYVREKGLAGLFYWTGSGDREGSESLVKAGWVGLTRGC